MVASAARTLIACAPVAAWCALLLAFWPGTGRIRGDAALVGLAVAGGAALFMAASTLLRAPERVALSAILPRRRRA